MGGFAGIVGRFLRGREGGGERERKRHSCLPMCRRSREVRGMRDGRVAMADTKL